MRETRRSRLSAALAVIVVAACACPAFGAEPAAPPRRRTPLEPARVDDDHPRVSLKKEALQRTLSTIADRSQTLETRINAIGLAGLGRLREAAPTLAAVLGRNDDIEVKVAAVWALREIGDPGAIPALLRVQADAVGLNPKLKYEKKVAFPDAGVEMAFIELIEDGIGRLGATVIGKYLVLLSAPAGSYRSQDDKLVNRQRSALAVIVCIGDRDHRAIEAMGTILKSPKESYPADFRQTAALGLARVLVARTREFAVVRAQDKVADEITEMLVGYIVEIEPSPVREYLASALNIARPVTAVTLLTRRFADNSPEPVRQKVIEILAMLRSRESVEALVWALENEKSAELRWRAVFGLGLAGESGMAHKALVKALEDKSPAVRRAAIGAIGRSGAKGGVELIAPGVRDPDPTIRAAAAKALGRAHDPAALEPLLTAAQDTSIIVRATAIAALGSIPSRKSFIAVARAAQDDARPVRFAALKVLGNIHNAPAHIVLLRLVGDPDRKIKADASLALRIARARHPAEFKKALIHVISDPENPASADACDFADFPDDAEIVEVLRKAAHSKRPGVRASAIRMLGSMGLK
ncbi:MAG: HEAT repeat domain-containing protein [Planctomycetota bacterium]